MAMRTRSISIEDLSEDDIVIPQTANYQEWPVSKIERSGNTRITWRITWQNGTTTRHSSRARFAVKI